MYIPKVKQPHIPSYKGIMNQTKVIDWLCRKEGILLKKTMYKRFITQKDENCDACGAELPRGSSCLVSEDGMICEDCAEERDSKSE